MADPSTRAFAGRAEIPFRASFGEAGGRLDGGCLVGRTEQKVVGESRTSKQAAAVIQSESRRVSSADEFLGRALLDAAIVAVP
jgi:hypothetical protein